MHIFELLKWVPSRGRTVQARKYALVLRSSLAAANRRGRIAESSRYFSTYVDGVFGSTSKYAEEFCRELPTADDATQAMAMVFSHCFD